MELGSAGLKLPEIIAAVVIQLNHHLGCFVDGNLRFRPFDLTGGYLARHMTILAEPGLLLRSGLGRTWSGAVAGEVYTLAMPTRMACLTSSAILPILSLFMMARRSASTVLGLKPRRRAISLDVMPSDKRRTIS